MGQDDANVAAAARKLSLPRRDGHTLFVPLPHTLDGLNCRLLRKIVLSRLLETRALVFEARALARIGRVGAVTLWQLMQMAERHGIVAEIRDAARGVCMVLNAIHLDETRRQAASVHADGSTTVLTREHRIESGSRVTVRLRRLDTATGEVRASSRVIPIERGVNERRKSFLTNILALRALWRRKAS